MPVIQWYPGHIAKLERQLAELLKLVDVVLEVLDARMPAATINTRLRARLAHKPVLTVLSKADLADPVQTQRWLDGFKRTQAGVIVFDPGRGAGGVKKLVEAILQQAEPRLKAQQARGLGRRPVRVLIAGMPNVGKSTLINRILGKNKVQTGHKAGVTRAPQWLRIHPAIELMDTPGVIPPALDSEETGCLLAVAHSVGEASFEEEAVSYFLLARLEALYPGLARKHYRVPDDWPLDLESIAQSRKFLLPGGASDTLRAAQSVLADFRQGRLGRVSLQHA